MSRECQQNCCYWDEIGPEKNEGFNLWLTAGRLSQQFRIYCVAPDHVWLNPFLHIWSNRFASHIVFTFHPLSSPFPAARCCEDLKPPNTKMKRVIWDFGITNVLRNDEDVFGLIKYRVLMHPIFTNLLSLDTMKRRWKASRWGGGQGDSKRAGTRCPRLLILIIINKGWSSLSLKPSDYQFCGRRTTNW